MKHCTLSKSRPIAKTLRLAVHLLLMVMSGLLMVPATATAEVIDVDSQRVSELREQGIAVIDIRRLDEWQDTGVIEGSHLMTFFDEDGNHDAAGWFERFSNRLDPDQPVILICRSGVRSEKVTHWLSKRMKLPTVYNAEEGILGWKSNGRETVEAP